MERLLKGDVWDQIDFVFFSLFFKLLKTNFLKIFNYQYALVASKQKADFKHRLRLGQVLI